MKNKKSFLNRKRKPYADFDDAFEAFVRMNCMTATDWSDDSLQYAECEIRIVLNKLGGGYIHKLNENSDTLEFITMNHYKLTNTPKPKHLQ